MAAEYLPGTPRERIRDLRKEAKLNQDEFAEAIGIIRSTLGDIELDKRSISSTTALEIAKYFNVSVDFVLAKTDGPKHCCRIYLSPFSQIFFFKLFIV